MAHVPAAERREQLVRAAIELLMRSGPAAGSTRAIAKELGVPQATLHYVFGSKEELYRAVIVQLTDEFLGYVRAVEVPAGTDFEDSIATLTARLWQTVLDQPRKHQLLGELEMVALRSPQMREITADHRLEIDRITSALIDDTATHFGIVPKVDTIRIARFYFAALDGLINQHLTAPSPDVEEWCLARIVDNVRLMVVSGADTTGRPLA
ncbi:TetR/AcrR family transcriptional regulator [Rhodococcus sovatensis]|uniref:TetR/AcrR family transcriptional regulator n=1 Tax=Rhodococcus sovatensis TaxID=1805840 RepID=A0ABZ2PM84_9NOCA